MDDLISYTIKGIVRGLPYYIKNKKNLDRILEPINALTINEKQCIVNSLVSQFDHTLPYNYVTNETELRSLSPFTFNADNNLVLNIRSVYGENVARYIFGYKPEAAVPNTFYMFSNLVPTNRFQDRSDYIYVDQSCYEKWLIPYEICEIAKSKNEALLTLPILLKHWEHFVDYMTSGEELKKRLISDLKRLNCNEYCERVQALQPSFYSQPAIDIESLGQKESYGVLYVHFLEEYYDLLRIRLNNDEIGLLLYKTIGETDLSNLNTKLPPLKSIQLGNVDNKGIKRVSFKDLPRPRDAPPAPPMPNFGISNLVPMNFKKPTQNWSSVTIQNPSNQNPSNQNPSNQNPSNQNPSNQSAFSQAMSKFVRPKDPPPSIPEKVLYIQKKGDSNYDDIPPKPKQDDSKRSLIEELTRFLKSKFSGGDSYTYKEDKDDVTKVDCGGFPDPELDFIKSSLPRLEKQSNSRLGSVDELKYRLFSNAKVGNFLNTPMFMKNARILHAILARNKHYFLEYKFKGYDIECFIVLDNVDIDAVRAYRTYFEMMRGLVFYMNENSSGSIASIPRENLMYIGLSVLTALNNFGYYVFRDLIAFRNYIDGFYTLTKRLNSDNTPVVSLYSSIHSVIHDFLDKTRVFVGGSEQGKAYDYHPHFNFFVHAYLLDVIRSHRKGEIREARYLSETMNNMPVKIFWDGISFDRLYNSFSLEKKYLYTVMYQTFFVDNKYEGSCFKTKYSSDMKDTRVVFLANEVTETLSVQQLLENLSNRVVRDMGREIDSNLLADELEKIFGNDVIRNIDKLKIVKDPSHVPVFIKAIQDKNLNLEPATVLEAILFFFAILEKLGFEVVKTFGKTNMKVVVKPAILRDNIARELRKYPDQAEMNQEFLERYGTMLERLFNQSSVEERGGSEINTEQTEIVISLPLQQAFTIDKDINADNVEKVFSSKEGILSKEIEDFNKGITLMINSNNISEDVIYRLVPYYIKEQIRLTSDLDESVDEKGGSSKIDSDVISIFLRRIEELSERSPMNNMLSEEDLTKAVDKFLQEKYIYSMDRLIPFYDNKISVGNGRDKAFLLLRHTLDTVNYMRTNMKIDLTDNIKMGLINIVRLKQNSDEYCYKVFIIIQYIRHMIEELYNKLKIQPENRTINFMEFSEFFKIINKKLKERDDKYKNIVSEKTLDYINKKLGTNYTSLPINSIDKTFLEIFDPEVKKVQLIKNP
jgi:hypothetical protein